MTPVNKTPLFEIHQSLGAKLVPFAGWQMPIRYSGIIDEHLCVRERAGLFDVSHMGEIEVVGAGAFELLQKATTNDVSKLYDGKAQYSLLCQPDGGIVDDLLVYRISSAKYLLCVNCANKDKDYKWISEMAAAEKNVSAVDKSAEYAQIALQGPLAQTILQSVVDCDLETIGSFEFEIVEVDGCKTIVSRTGYTGEDGFELYLAPEGAAGLWRQIMSSGASSGIMPVGLGARDTLRTEMKYPLYGNDIGADTDPLEAGLQWVVKFDKGDFVGREALMQKKEAGLTRKLVCIEMAGRHIPRTGCAVFSDKRQIGVVTSGTKSPTLNVGIAIAYVDIGFEQTGASLTVDIRGKQHEAKIVAAPFYKRSG